MTLATTTGPADLRDQRWLDERIAAARNGIEAVIDIALNWTEGRGVGRLCPGVSAADYVREHVGLVGREAIVPLLTESNWSNRQIAAVAGVDEGTVRNELRKVPQLTRPTETLGADNKVRPASRPTPIGPRLDPTPDPYFDKRVVRTVTAQVIEEAPRATPYRVIAQAFERDIRHLRDGYRSHLDDERFAARFGVVIAAIDAALEV